MDINQSPQIPQPAPEKKKFNGLLFLEIGLVEVFSVIFALLLIFGTLNYFGILPISESFPFLSFLPQKQKMITNKTVTTGAGLATIGGKVLTETDLATHERLLNGPKRYIQLIDKSTKLLSRDEVLEDLIKVTKMEIGAAKLKITPKDAEVKAKKTEILKQFPDLEKNYPAYGWSEADFTRDNFIKMLKEKVQASVVAWREAEYVTVRWDVIKIDPNEIDSYTKAATTLLKKYQDRFSRGEDVDNLLADIQKDPDLTKTFLSTRAAQIYKLSDDKSIRLLQRTTVENSKEVTSKHILTLRVGTKDELWCNKDACYLIRVVGGNEGKFNSIEEWLKTI